MRDRLQACKALLAAHKKHLSSSKSPDSEYSGSHSTGFGSNASNRHPVHSQQVRASDWSVTLGQQGIQEAMPPPFLISRMAKDVLEWVLHSCVTRDGRRCIVRLRCCIELIESEVLPQASRWHRRDLTSALTAVLSTVLQALIAVYTGTRKVFEAQSRRTV